MPISLTEMIAVLEALPWLFMTMVFVFGALVGSFLNVVIYRLPLMLEAAWKGDSAYIQALVEQGYSLIKPRPMEFVPPETNAEPLSLSHPASHCPGCKTQIKPWHNIPMLSYLWLRGRCATKTCESTIPRRYFVVELFTALVSLVVAQHFGVTMACLLALILTWCLIALTIIDLDTQLLPDQIVLPLVWLGLIINYYGVFTDLQSAVLGAVFGYMSLWVIFQTFKLLTGKEGMGFGDFKLFAALGAWLGVQALPGILMLASVVGSIIGLSLMLFKGHGRQVPIAFGPYLALAGWLSLVASDIIEMYIPTRDIFILFSI